MPTEDLSHETTPSNDEPGNVMPGNVDLSNDDPSNDDLAAQNELSNDDLAAHDVSSGDAADTAAASALARARATARAKGLRPGTRPARGRSQGQTSTAGSGRDGRDGRDPALLGDQLDRLLLDRGWSVDVAVGSIMGRWPAIVGSEVAQHCIPVTFDAGVLVVRADSTAWATQLRLLSSSILGRLESEVGKDTVSELRVQGPSAPSWNHGSRKSTGPGPRDTYG